MLNCWPFLLSVAFSMHWCYRVEMLSYGHGRICTSLSKFPRTVPRAPGLIRPGRKYWSCYGGTRYYGTFG
ncbi:hypothetical protein M6B38_383950 [Iris pallida]|uniref:Secreted protein n=1 Tax=Iris pallida TaxID=29817 RepID=A0AAX6G3W1_IRIPA|nr:hypothetical protein M6B38_383950 [Iris pallida]